VVEHVLDRPHCRAWHALAEHLLPFEGRARREAGPHFRHQLGGMRMRIPDPQRRAAAHPFELSDGMCQRVMIAMALTCEPALLIADEPTTGLDITTQAVIMDLIAASGGR
jgi:peptide/nickel transport system ATP-binding protein